MTVNVTSHTRLLASIATYSPSAPVAVLRTNHQIAEPVNTPSDYSAGMANANYRTGCGAGASGGP